MYKVEFKTQLGQQGSVYVVASCSSAAVAKVKAYFKLLKQEIEIGLISFQSFDMFIELKRLPQ